MGRVSTKENKTQYQLFREELGLSRERAVVHHLKSREQFQLLILINPCRGALFFYLIHLAPNEGPPPC